MKYKYFLKNLSILTISKFVSRLILFFMLPLYTNILTTEEYGIIDIITTTAQLAMPIFTLCITEAIIRFSMEKKNNKNSILSIAFNTFIKGYAIIVPISFAAIFFLKINYIYILLFNLYYIVLALGNIFTYYLKGLERVKIIGIASVIKILILVSFNLLFLLYFKLGIIGYYLSFTISELVYIIILFVSYKKVKIKDDVAVDKKELKKEMVAYSKPFILNSISWWINNASDKYIILLFYNADLMGIYSVAYKIPTIIEFVQDVIAQAWQISAIKEYKSKDTKIFFSNMYNIYNVILVFAVAFILIFLKLLAKILFAKDFFMAWKFVPFLLVAIMFGALSGFLGSIYAANKDSKMYAKSTAIGAVSNIILNFLLIPKFGAQGAAIATCISYIIIWILRILFMKKYITLEIKYLKNILSYLLIILMCIFTIIFNTNYAIFSNIAIIILLFIIYFKDIKTLIFKLKGMILCKK